MQSNDHITFTGQEDATSGEPITRDELIRTIRRAGLTYHSSICSLSTVLVASEESLQKRTLKVRKAEAQGVRIISYHQLFAELLALREARVTTFAIAA